ncbi:MAG: hypothetical protein R3C25_12030 [Hyphomonadaceae bacterium]
MTEDLQLLTAWQRSIVPAFRELRRQLGLFANLHLQMPDDARQFCESDELRHAMAAYRVGKDEGSEASQAIYRAIGKLPVGEAVELFRNIKRSHKRRGRKPGSGPFISYDDRRLKTYAEMRADGHSRHTAEAVASMQAETFGGPKAGKDRIQKKIRKLERTRAEKIRSN